MTTRNATRIGLALKWRAPAAYRLDGDTLIHSRTGNRSKATKRRLYQLKREGRLPE
jgi:hypothetical protein